MLQCTIQLRGLQLPHEGALVVGLVYSSTSSSCDEPALASNTRCVVLCTRSPLARLEAHAAAPALRALPALDSNTETIAAFQFLLGRSLAAHLHSARLALDVACVAHRVCGWVFTARAVLSSYKLLPPTHLAFGSLPLRSMLRALVTLSLLVLLMHRPLMEYNRSVLGFSVCVSRIRSLLPVPVLAGTSAAAAGGGVTPALGARKHYMLWVLFSVALAFLYGPASSVLTLQQEQIPHRGGVQEAGAWLAYASCSAFIWCPGWIAHVVMTYALGLLQYFVLQGYERPQVMHMCFGRAGSRLQGAAGCADVTVHAYWSLPETFLIALTAECTAVACGCYGWSMVQQQRQRAQQRKQSLEAHISTLQRQKLAIGHNKAELRSWTLDSPSEASEVLEEQRHAEEELQRSISHTTYVQRQGNGAVRLQCDATVLTDNARHELPGSHAMELSAVEPTAVSSRHGVLHIWLKLHPGISITDVNLELRSGGRAVSLPLCATRHRFVSKRKEWCCCVPIGGIRFQRNGALVLQARHTAAPADGTAAEEASNPVGVVLCTDSLRARLEIQRTSKPLMANGANSLKGRELIGLHMLVGNALAAEMHGGDLLQLAQVTGTVCKWCATTRMLLESNSEQSTPSKEDGVTGAKVPNRFSQLIRLTVQVIAALLTAKLSEKPIMRYNLNTGFSVEASKMRAYVCFPSAFVQPVMQTLFPATARQYEQKIALANLIVLFILWSTVAPILTLQARTVPFRKGALDANLMLAMHVLTWLCAPLGTSRLQHFVCMYILMIFTTIRYHVYETPLVEHLCQYERVEVETNSVMRCDELLPLYQRLALDHSVRGILGHVVIALAHVALAKLQHWYSSCRWRMKQDKTA